MKKYFIPWLAAYFTIFITGYIFHDILAHDFFDYHIGHLTREAYIIPLIALSFAIFVAILTYLFPIFYQYYRDRYSPIVIGAWMGGLMGFLWDALQGGLIEVATFEMPFIVFAVDSTYHLLEGMLAGVIIAALYTRFDRHDEKKSKRVQSNDGN